MGAPVRNIGALWVIARGRLGSALASTGDIEAFRAAVSMNPPPPRWAFINRLSEGVATLYLGDIERALSLLAAAAAERVPKSWTAGVAEANLFMGYALTGRTAQALHAYARLEPLLARPGWINLHGGWLALTAAVAGLALLGEHDRCAALYPATVDLLGTGQVCDSITAGPNTPLLSAAIAAAAGGDTQQAIAHFEVAMHLAETAAASPAPAGRQVLVWQVRREASGHARGAALLMEAEAQFHALGMTLHRQLAREAASASFHPS